MPSNSPFAPNEQVPTVLGARLVVDAFKRGLLGPAAAPEDDEPAYAAEADRWSFLALTISVNYRRNSIALMESARRAYANPDTRWIFNEESAARVPISTLHDALVRTRVAIQPNRQVAGWRTLAQTVVDGWGSFETLVTQQDSYSSLRRIVQHEKRKLFPYLSGPKLFNYWLYSMDKRGMTAFADRGAIDLPVDTHVLKSSALLGIREAREGASASAVAARWKEVLMGEAISPLDLTVPLWAWSRANFEPDLATLYTLNANAK